MLTGERFAATITPAARALKPKRADELHSHEQPATLQQCRLLGPDILLF